MLCGLLILLFEIFLGYLDNFMNPTLKNKRKKKRRNNMVHTLTFNFACLFIAHYFELQLDCFVTQEIYIFFSRMLIYTLRFLCTCPRFAPRRPIFLFV